MPVSIYNGLVVTSHVIAHMQTPSVTAAPSEEVESSSTSEGEGSQVEQSNGRMPNQGKIRSRKNSYVA